MIAEAASDTQTSKMMEKKQVIIGSVPSKETWLGIPNSQGRYQINNHGDIRVYYKYRGHELCLHYKLLKPDGRNVSLSIQGIKKKYSVDYLIEQCFGVQHVPSLDGEIWKPITGYEGVYKVSNKGRILAVRHFITRKNGVKQFCKEQIIKPSSTINSGYNIVNLIKEGDKQRHFLIHRLVALAFVPNPYNLPEVNHIDENKQNNDSSNLEWCTKQYNSVYGTCQERRIQTRLRNNSGKYGYKRRIKR